MDLIILTDGMYHLIPVTELMLQNVTMVKEFNVADLCDVLRLKLTTYYDYPINQHLMKDGSGAFYGCIMR
jgi:hypothetical protein